MGNPSLNPSCENTEVTLYVNPVHSPGGMAIIMVVYWCALGVYANQLAGKLFRSPKFLDSVRLHTKTICKVSAAGEWCVCVCVYVCVWRDKSARQRVES